MEPMKMAKSLCSPTHIVLSNFKFRGDGKEKSDTNWTIQENICDAHFNEIYRAEVINDNGKIKCAVKKIHRSGFLQSQKGITEVKEEFKKLKKLNHERVIQLFELHIVDRSVFVFMENIQDSLEGHISRNGALNEITVKHFIRQLIKAVEFLHRENFVQISVESSYVYFTDNTNIKLANFGVLKDIEICHRTLTNEIGSPRYYAPETIEVGYIWSYPANVWSIGCVALEMITGSKPYSELGLFHIIAKFTSANPSPLQENIEKCLSASCRAFFKQIFEKDPAKRSTLEDLVFHEFLKGDENGILETLGKGITEPIDKDRRNDGYEATENDVVTEDENAQEKSSLSEYGKSFFAELNEDDQNFPSNWVKGKMIGRGSLSKVYLAHINHSLFVVKSIKNVKQKPSGYKKFVRQCLNEVEIMQRLRHKNIVRYYGYSITNHSYNIFLEYMPRGTLLVLVKVNGPLSEKVAKRYTKELLEAVHYLHSVEICHRDIKSSNVLISDNSIKLADFGVAKSVAKDALVDEYVGTIRYMAPEEIQCEVYNGYFADIWSVGCVVLEMLTNNLYGSMNQITVICLISKGSTPLQHIDPFMLSEPANNFLEKIFYLDPTKRATSKELLQDQYLYEDEDGAWRHPEKDDTESNKIEYVPTSVRSRKRKETDEQLVKRYKTYDVFVKKTEGVITDQLTSVDCIKCPQHTNYTDMTSLSLQHLPGGYQYPEVLDLIRSLADLTVMIDVKSRNRLGIYCQGTGKIEKVALHKDSAEITITTSVKLVSENLQPKNYTCTMQFYDSDRKNNNPVYINGDRMEEFNLNENVCKFICITFDLDLAKKLHKLLSDFSESLRLASTLCADTIIKESKRLAILVSHPHGCSKHVYFGECHKDEITFNDPVCPGCSGSYVLTLDDTIPKEVENIACKMTEMTSFDEDVKSSVTDFEDEHDIFIKDNIGPSDKQLESITCKKQSKHSQFIDLSSDFLKHLPACYQHNEMTDLIKSLADLTVMIEVEKSGYEKSPNYYQGSGKIDKVIMNEKRPCVCSNCRTSKTPSEKWGEVIIITSASLLKNNDDAITITCTFFYDNDQKKEIKSLNGNKIITKSEKRDVCKFTCVTCDKNILEKLEIMLDVFAANWRQCYDKYVYTVKSNKERIILLVSHPHGCKRYLSIGKWVKDNRSNKYGQKEDTISYKAPTCPGCSGAYILVPDFDEADEINGSNY